MTFFELPSNPDDQIKEMIVGWHEQAKQYSVQAKKSRQRRNLLMAQAIREGQNPNDVASWVGLSRQAVDSAISGEASLFDESADLAGDDGA